MIEQQAVDRIAEMAQELRQERNALKLLNGELLEELQSMVRIVKAFGYTTQLGTTQKERLERAANLIARLTPAANRVTP